MDASAFPRPGEQGRWRWEQRRQRLRFVADAGADPGRARLEAATTAVGVLIVDDDEVTRYANPAAAELVGYRPGDLVGRPLGRLRDASPAPWAPGELSMGTEGVEERCLRLRHSSGAAVWVSVLAAPLADGAGSVLLVWDQTTAGAAEGRVRHSEARFRALVRHAASTMAVVDDELVVRYVSPSAEPEAAHRGQQMLGRPLLSVVHDHDRERVGAVLGSVLAGEGDSQRCRLRMSDSEGGWLEYEVEVSDQRGDPALGGLLCALRDVGDQVAGEEALAGSERRYRQVAERCPTGVLIHVGGRVAYANPAVTALLGFDRPEELVGLATLGLTHPRSKQMARARLAAIEAGAITPPARLSLLRRDGTEVEVSATSFPFDHEGRPAILGYITDLSDLGRVEAADRRYRRLIELFPTCFVIHVAGELVLANPAAAALVGAANPAEMLGHSVLEYVHPDDWALVRARMAAALRGEDTQAEQEMRLVRADGEVIEVTTSASSIEHDGRTARLVIINDLTTRRRAEAAVEASEALFRGAFLGTGAGMALVSTEGRYLRLNQRCGALLGRNPAEVVGTDWLDTVHPGDRDGAAAMVGEVLGAGACGEAHGELRFCRPEGAEVPGLVSLAAVSGPDGGIEHLVFQVQDASALKRAEEEVRQLNTALVARLEELQQARQDLRDMLAKLSRAQEAERKAISVALHDDAVQSLTAATWSVDELRSCADPSARSEALDRLGASLDHALRSARGMMFELRSYVLDELGLGAAVAEQLRALEAASELRTVLRDRLGGARFAEHTETLAFRTVQEALRNVRKHASAGEVEVVIEVLGPTLAVSVYDDGVGVVMGELAQARARGHIGIASMEETLRAAGGAFSVGPCQGRPGTLVRFRLPADPPAE